LYDDARAQFNSMVGTTLCIQLQVRQDGQEARGVLLFILESDQTWWSPANRELSTSTTEVNGPDDGYLQWVKTLRLQYVPAQIQFGMITIWWWYVLNARS